MAKLANEVLNTSSIAAHDDLQSRAAHAIETWSKAVKATKRNWKLRLEAYRLIGDLTIEIQAMYAHGSKDKKLAFRQTGLNKISKQDRSDAAFIAANWQELQKFMKFSGMQSATISYLRKSLKAAQAETSETSDQPKAETSETSDQPKAEASETSDQPKAEEQPKKPTQKAAAEQVANILREYGFTPSQAQKVLKLAQKEFKVTTMTVALEKAKAA